MERREEEIERSVGENVERRGRIQQVIGRKAQLVMCLIIYFQNSRNAKITNFNFLELFI